MRDIPVVVNCLNAEANKEWLESVPEEALAEAIHSPSFRLLVYRSNDDALAFAYLSHFDTAEPKLEEFAVLEAGRGHGTESLAALLDYLEHNAAFKRLWLHVVTYNDRALSIYRKLGFTDQSIVPGGWTNRLGKHVSIYRLWKNLNRPES